MFKKRHPKVGARPGTLVAPESAPPPKVRLMSYTTDGVEDRDVQDPEELREAFREDSVTWVDVQGFGDLKLIRKVGEIFALHPLLLEDLVNAPQRPKTEPYSEQLLILLRMARLEEKAAEGGADVEDWPLGQRIKMEQLSIVLGKSYVLTVQEEYGDVLDPVRRRIRAGKGIIRQQGAGYLAYALADTIVDAYYPLLESLGDELEQLEDRVALDPTPAMLQRLNRLRNQLVAFRRTVWPQREAIQALIREERQFVGEEVRVFLRDTYDHCLQTADVIEMYRDMAANLMNTYLTSVANRTNDVMKLLTLVATIFIPLTFLVGVYGMNFENMPELSYRWGYPAVWLAMFVTAGAMLLFFRRKGWIGSRHRWRKKGNRRTDR